MLSLFSEVPQVIWSDDHTSTAREATECDYDCDGGDCACALDNRLGELLEWREASIDHLRLSQAPASLSVPLDDQWRIRLGPTHPPIVLNHPAEALWSLFGRPRELHELFSPLDTSAHHESVVASVRQLYHAGLLIPCGWKDPAVITRSTTLTAWVHITDRCNLRCSYCYLPHLCQDMSLATGLSVIDATFRSARQHQFTHVKLKYAGGEPLLNFALIEDLHRHAIDLARATSTLLQEVVLTNGTLLTADICRRLHDWSTHLMISLDGLGAVHDCQRPFRSGASSFAQVTHGIDHALAAGLMPNISITVSGRNAGGLAELVAWLIDRDLPFGFNFYRENSLSAGLKDLRLDEAKIVDGVLAAFETIKAKLPRQSLLRSIVDRADLLIPHSKTCGVGDNYLVFDPHGRVAMCQTACQHSTTSADSEDPLLLVRSNRSGIRNLTVDEKEGCCDCVWKYWCTGGCPLETFRATGRFDTRSPHCHIYQQLYPAALRLEGHRILAYYSKKDT
jgi:uncharacterized protein